MRVNGMSQWIMWKVLDTVRKHRHLLIQQRMEMMSKHHDIVDKPDALTLTAKKGAIH